MANYEDFDLESYQRAVLLDIQQEWSQSRAGLLGDCKIVEFESRREFGRKRLSPVRVELFVRDGKAYVIRDGEIRANRKAVAPDVMACEVLSHLPWEERTVEKLLQLTPRKR